MSAATLPNGHIKAGLDALVELCDSVNRLPVLAALASTRALKVFAAAWASCDEVKNTLIAEHGTKDSVGNTSIAPNTPAMTSFVEAWSLLLAHAQVVDFEAIDIHDIEQGYSRDPDTKEKGPLKISPTSLSMLIDLGVIIVEADSPAKKKKAA